MRSNPTDHSINQGQKKLNSSNGSERSSTSAPVSLDNLVETDDLEELTRVHAAGGGVVSASLLEEGHRLAQAVDHGDARDEGEDDDLGTHGLSLFGGERGGQATGDDVDEDL